MPEREFYRKKKEDRPVIAICYDFDKTLTPDDMQAQGFIQSIGFEVADFWREANALAQDNDMDQNLAYMYKMKEEAAGRVLFTKKALQEFGSKVTLFPGVEDWFSRIREYGVSQGVIVEHYIISSGLKEMIEGTSVAGEFERIYASSFYFNEKGVPLWPAQVVNYTNKTQFLFRIEKGVLDVNDPAVNDSFAPDALRVPFRNMIYIGDSDTDIPCMKLVNTYGGHSIGVFDAQTADKSKVYKMSREGRIKYFAPADYSEGSELDGLVKAIIDRTASNEALESLHYKNLHERIENDRRQDSAKREKNELMHALEESPNFASTHDIIKKLTRIGSWTSDERELLFEIALSNSQVFSILSDPDLKIFFKKILLGVEHKSERAAEVERLIDV